MRLIFVPKHDMALKDAWPVTPMTMDCRVTPSKWKGEITCLRNLDVCCLWIYSFSQSLEQETEAAQEQEA